MTFIPPGEDQVWTLLGTYPGQVEQHLEMGFPQHPPWCEHAHENGTGAKGIAVALGSPGSGDRLSREQSGRWRRGKCWEKGGG